MLTNYFRRLAFEQLEDRRVLAILTVNTLVDENNGIGTGGVSLRDAVNAANNGDIIQFSVTGQINLTSAGDGHLVIDRSITIQGPGANLITIKAHDPDGSGTNNSNGHRAFLVDNDNSTQMNVTISGLTFTNGDPEATDENTGGGAILNRENLTINNCVFTGNFAGNGGAILNALNSSGSTSGIGTLTINDSAFDSNRADTDGGAIVVEAGSLVVNRSSITNNIADNSGGGVLARGRNVTVNDSTISGNTTQEAGGGLYQYQGSLTVNNSTISSNAADSDQNDVGNGGGIFNQGGALTVLQSTISGNTGREGAGIFSDTGSTPTVSHSTITGNVIPVAGTNVGGGINSPGTMNLKHTIVAGNLRGASQRDDVSGDFDAEYSLIGDRRSASVTNVVGSLIGTTALPINAMLGPLASNGGPTQTHLLLAGSPAIDAGNTAAVAGVSGIPQFDQRGTPFSRVVDYDGAGGARIDMGAIEMVVANQPPTNPTAVTLTAIDEDVANASNGGTLVSAIVTASGSTDPNGNIVGIGVTAANNANGQWQYSTDAGGNWLNLTSLSTTAARLLAPAHLVRFVPHANFNSQVGASPTIDFKAWDQTSGAAGGTGDTTSGSAYSALAALATQSVTAVNDAPGFTLPSTLVQRNEDDGAVTVNGFATSIARGPATATDEGAQVLTFVLSVTGTTGNLTFTSAPAIDPTTGALTFTLAPNANGTATIDAVLQDNGSGTSPNVNASAPQTFTIDVAAVNDEQVLATNNGLTLARGSSAVISASLLETTDVDDLPNDLVYTVTSGPTHGTLLVNGTPATQFTQQQINSGLVSYQHDGTATLADSLGLTADDGEGTASSGTFQITIQPFAGDYNGNSNVDAGDYVLWRKTAGTSVPQAYAGADGNGDTIIDESDYTVWRSNFGNSLAPGSGAGALLWTTAAEDAGSNEERGGRSSEAESSAVATDLAIELLLLTRPSESSGDTAGVELCDVASDTDDTSSKSMVAVGSDLSILWQGL